MICRARKHAFGLIPFLFLFSLLFTLLVTGITPIRSWAYSSKDAYLQAEQAYNSFKTSPKTKYRQVWLEHVNAFKRIYTDDPEGPLAPDAMYMVASVYRELYRFSGKTGDLNEAADAYVRLCNRFPKNRLAGKSKEALDGIEKLRIESTQSPPVKKADRPVAAEMERPPELNRISEIRYWSTSSYTRVVISAENEVTFEDHVLRKTPERAKARLYLDILNSTLLPELKKPIAVMDGLLDGIRAAQHDKNTVRVVLDMAALKKYKVFNLVNPFRIVIDIVGDGHKKQAGLDPDKLTIAQQLGLGVRTIVLDPGHGGKDCGAIGSNGLREKDITLKVAKKLKEKIRKLGDCRVILTREKDRFLALEERTAIANAKECDLFVSIHANAAPNKDARGIETYILNVGTDDNAMRVAARENATSTRNISDLQKILADLMLNSKINESYRLAEHVQNTMVAELSKTYDHVNNLGVKQAPFFVLIGARMPCVLVEISFLSNPSEAELLKKDEYLEEIACHLAGGIQKYANETNFAHISPGMRPAESP
ncbi:MAG: N-acetylmuramoyl-L-alanine amidase [Pseudomonadota bacterium]